MGEDCRSWCRNDASTGVRRSRWPEGIACTLTWEAMRPLFAVLGVQVALGVILAVLLISGVLPLSSDGKPGTGAARVDRFDGHAAWRLLKQQVAPGPRPAGSDPSRALAAHLKTLLPHGRYQFLPGGLSNVVGRVRGRDPSRYVVVGAHYDTKDIPGFVGANDGAGGTAALVTLARGLKPRTIGPTVVFIAFDGEESPGAQETSDFYAKGLRGSKVAAKAYRRAEAMILLDFVADKELSLP